MSRREEKEPSKLDPPPDDFCEWWNPTHRDHESGADVGGHPDAERVWARKDPGRWVRRTYGASARVAWNSQCYRDEYLTWIQLGRPQRTEFISLAATNERQMQFYRDFMPLYQWCFVGQSMPEEDNTAIVKILNEKYPGHEPIKNPF